MDSCDKLFKKSLSEEKSNEQIYKLAINEFLTLVDKDFALDCFKSLPNGSMYFNAKHIYESEHCNLFIEILKKYNFNEKFILIESLFDLGNNNSDYPNIKNIYENVPFIDKILKVNNKYIIYSEKYGKFEFYKVPEYFKNNFRLISYIHSHSTIHNCHSNTYNMRNILTNDISITSKCRNEFMGTYYHSYTFDREKDLIIDLCSNTVMKKEQFDKLFEAKLISAVRNVNIDYELSITNEKTNQDKHRLPLLKIALYKEFLANSGYCNDLEDAPKTKRII